MKSELSGYISAFDFLLGEWQVDMVTMPEGSTVGRRATLHVRRILDGAAILDEIRHVDQAGEVNFRGATFRTYLPDRDRWYVLWMMANVEGYTELDARAIDGEVHTTGTGRDPGGELVERGRYHDISSDAYSFTLERSYDSGKTWTRPFVSFRATRVHPEETSRNLVSISPFFIVKDLQASIAHYIERFGFRLDFQGPPGDVYYGRVSRDGIGIMLKTILPDVLPRPNHTRHEWARWDASIYTLDPDPLFHEFKQRGASFVKELSFIDDGLWGFEVTDADGYVLAFFRLRNK